MTGARRWTLWLLLLALSTALVLFGRDQPSERTIVDAAPARLSRAGAGDSPRIERDSHAQDAMILAIRPRRQPARTEDAFEARDWKPPTLPTAKLPPAPPMAPPLPYTVFGKKQQDGVWQVFLRRDERILVVRAQDTIESMYRVDEIRPPVMTVVYLPLQQRQSVPIGGAE